MAESDLEILRLASSNLEVPAGVRHSFFIVHLRIFLALTLVSFKGFFMPTTIALGKVTVVGRI